jgi:hypothetical protein
MHTKFWLENFKGGNAEDTNVDERIIEFERNVKVWTGLNCFKVGFSGRFLF